MSKRAALEAQIATLKQRMANPSDIHDWHRARKLLHAAEAELRLLPREPQPLVERGR